MLRVRDQCGGCAAGLEHLFEVPHQFAETELDAFYSSSSQRLSVELVTCPTCQLVQTGAFLDGESLQAAYADAEDDEHSKQFEHRRRSFTRALEQSVFPSIPSLSRSPWLDVGTAAGAFVAAARELGVDASGIEPSVHIVDQAPPDVRPHLRVGFLEPADESGRVQVISYWDVLEHVPNPREEVMRVKEHLDVGGFLVLNLPMIDTVSARLLRRRWPFYLNVHLYYFTRRSLRKFLEPLGFEVLAIHSYSQTLDLQYLLSRYLRGRTPPALLARVPIRYRMGQRTVVAQRVS